jgi:hypothetical protein
MNANHCDKCQSELSAQYEIFLTQAEAMASGKRIMQTNKMCHSCKAVNKRFMAYGLAKQTK